MLLESEGREKILKASLKKPEIQLKRWLGSLGEEVTEM